MNSQDFVMWLDQMWLSEEAAAEVLGFDSATITRFRFEGAPLVVGLACAAVARDLPAWSAGRGKGRRRSKAGTSAEVIDLQEFIA